MNEELVRDQDQSSALLDDLKREFSDRLFIGCYRAISDRLDFLLKDFLIFCPPKALEPEAL